MNNIRYNQVRQKSAHNSYQRTEGYLDQALYWRIRSLEIDIHNSNHFDGWPDLKSNWYVYHSSLDSGTSVNTLSDALDVLSAFQEAVPQHEVITLWIDLKDGFVDSSDQTPESLDQLIAAKLGRSNIWGPPDAIGTYDNLQQAICENGWPTLKSLQGKFILACTTGDLSSPDSHLNQYVDNGASANQRLAFVAPNISNPDDIFSHNYAVFFNLSSSHISLGNPIYEAGFISRAYNLNSQNQWCDGWKNVVHHLATNKINTFEDQWARTDIPETGYPFNGIAIDLPNDLTEPGSLCAIKVSSHDIWGKDDSCFFQYEDHSNCPTSNIDCFVGNPTSHVNGWIKAGIMARSSNSSSAANICILRTGNHGIRMQYRSSDGEKTEAIEANIAEGINGHPVVSDNTPIYLRLAITDSGRTANGSYSIDGKRWIYIGQATCTQPLCLQGWVASSHGDGEIKWLFGGTTVPKNSVEIGNNNQGHFISNPAESASLGPQQDKYRCSHN